MTPLADVVDWQGMRFKRREGSHGLGPVVEKMGPVMGFSITAKTPNLRHHWAATPASIRFNPGAHDDTTPEIVIIHPCGARWDGDLITMDAKEAVATCRLAPASTVIATHMGFRLHDATVSRDELRRYSIEQGVSLQQLRIPRDGETLQFAARRA